MFEVLYRNFLEQNCRNIPAIKEESLTGLKFSN